MSTNLTGAVQGGNLTLSKAGLAAGTTTTFTIGTTFTYAVAGALFSKASAANGASPTLDLNTGVAFKPLVADQACIFAFAVNAAGTVGVAQGPIVKNSDVTGGLAAVQFPGIADGSTIFGYLLAQAISTLVSTWTFGANNLSGVTGMTYTFRDVMDVPGQPITG